MPRQERGRKKVANYSRPLLPPRTSQNMERSGSVKKIYDKNLKRTRKEDNWK
jgi:hypothetical protein